MSVITTLINLMNHNLSNTIVKVSPKTNQNPLLRKEKKKKVTQTHIKHKNIFNSSTLNFNYTYHKNKGYC